MILVLYCCPKYKTSRYLPTTYVILTFCPYKARYTLRYVSAENKLLSLVNFFWAKIVLKINEVYQVCSYNFFFRFVCGQCS